jgi:putative ABC transport system ATP-binding protein
MVTHDATAASFADRLLFLRDGQIVRDEGPMTIDQVYELFKEMQ